jgi:hypothetical protein
VVLALGALVLVERQRTTLRSDGAGRFAQPPSLLYVAGIPRSNKGSACMLGAVGAGWTLPKKFRPTYEMLKPLSCPQRSSHAISNKDAHVKAPRGALAAYSGAGIQLTSEAVQGEFVELH